MVPLAPFVCVSNLEKIISSFRVYSFINFVFYQKGNPTNWPDVVITHFFEVMPVEIWNDLFNKWWSEPNHVWQDPILNL